MEDCAGEEGVGARLTDGGGMTEAAGDDAKITIANIPRSLTETNRVLQNSPRRWVCVTMEAAETGKAQFR